MPRTITVSGSRDWEFHELVERELRNQLTYALTKGKSLAIKVGDCPTGVDLFVKEWAEKQPLVVSFRIFRAEWDFCTAECAHLDHRVTKRPGDIHHPGLLDDYCPWAGPRRNRQLVPSDYGLIFNRNNSRGAANTKKLLKATGVKFDEWAMED